MVCNKCGDEKNIEAFPTRADTGGRRKTCRDCVNAVRKKWRHDTGRNDPAKRCVKMPPEYHKKHRQEWGKAYFQRIKGTEMYERRNIRIRARQRTQSATMSREDVDYVQIVKRDPCAYCGDAGGEWDHIVPVHDGGSHGWDNATGACATCNRKKHTKSLLHFLLT